MKPYLEYVEKTAGGLEDLSFIDLKRHQLLLTDEEGEIRERHTIYKSLLFDVKAADGETYHLSDGYWYRVEKNYIEKLEKFLDPLCCELNLPDYTQNTEGEYNEAFGASSPFHVCMDRRNVAPAGATAVKPCDVYGVIGGFGVLYHIKISTNSSALSHHFNQGANSIELLKAEDASLAMLKNLINEAGDHKETAALLSPIDDKKFKVVFAIISHKNPDLESKNLPLFSKISLMRVMKALRLMSVNATFGFVYDSKTS